MTLSRFARRGSFFLRLQQRQHGSDTLLLRATMDRISQHDIADGEATVPEQDALVIALAATLRAANDLADLGMDVIAGQPATLDQRKKRAAMAALCPIVDHKLVHAKG